MSSLKNWWPLLLVIWCCSCHSSKQALKQLEKGKHPQARASLDKTLEKDSINPAAHFVYALLYTDSAYQQYTVDSAYYHILLARSEYHSAEPKTKEKLFKSLALDSSRIEAQRLVIDSLAFGEAADTHTVSAYQFFIDRHGKQAPQYDEAIASRNQLAFEAVQAQDTYQAYKTFMDTYPQAAQYDQAKERYNTLVFREKTKGGNLDSYVNFLKTFPNTPYRNSAEEQIMKISTADNLPEHYAEFARQYPNSIYARQAVNQLYHLFKAKHPYQEFLQHYPGLPLRDSLKQVINQEANVLIPVLEKDRYGFMDIHGKTVISPSYPLIAEKYLCEGTTEEYIHVAVARNNRLDHTLLTKNGTPIFSFTDDAMPEAYPGTITEEAVANIGQGWLLIKQPEEGQYKLMHQSGFVVMPEGFTGLDTVAFMASAPAFRSQATFQFIKFQVDGLWGLMTFGGLTLLTPEYDDIEEYNQFVVIEKDEKMAVTTRQLLLDKANNQPINLDFSYDDVSLTDNRYLIAYAGNYETVLDTALNTKVPLGQNSIVRHITGEKWLVKKASTRQFVRNDSLISVRQPAYYIYQPQQTTFPTEYQKAYSNDRFMALRKKKGYDFIDLALTDSIAQYDSVKILSEKVALLFEPDTVRAYFSYENQKKMTREEKNRAVDFRLISTLNAASPQDQRSYLLVIRPDLHQLLNMKGESLFASSMDEVIAYPQSLFVIDKKGKKGIVDSLGNNVVPVRYQSIGNYKDSTLAVFHRQQFGFYHQPSGVFVEPEYEATVQPYGQMVMPGDSTASYLFIARKRGSYGLINDQNKSLIPFSFDEIRYWTDSTALVKKEEEWQIVRVYPKDGEGEEERVLFSGIEEFEDVSTSKDYEKLIKIYADGSYGIISSTQGQVLKPTYDEVLIFGKGKEQLYMTEKYVPEADLYIVVYLDASGNMLKRQALTAEQYDKLYCDGI